MIGAKLAMPIPQQVIIKEMEIKSIKIRVTQRCDCRSIFDFAQ